MEVWCQHRGCDRSDAEPQFTKPIKAVRKGESQPKWYCSKHKRLHPNVSPTSGKEVSRGKVIVKEVVRTGRHW